MAHTKNNAFGLDISDAMLKLVWLDDGGHIRSYQAVSLPEGAMEDGRIKNPAVFKKAIRILVEGVSGEKITISRVVASLPETHVFIKTIIMPKEEKAGAERFVFARISEYIPVSAGEVYIAWHDAGPVKGKPGDRRLTVAAARRDIVDEYETRLREAGLKVVGLQSESTALTAALIKPQPARAKDDKPEQGSFLVDLNPDHAVIVLVSDGAILFSMAVKNDNLHINNFIARVREKLERGNAWCERETGLRCKRITIVGNNEFQERLFSDLRAEGSYAVEVGDVYGNICTKKGVGHDIYRLPNSFTTAIGLALGSR